MAVDQKKFRHDPSGSWRAHLSKRTYSAPGIGLAPLCWKARRFSSTVTPPDIDVVVFVFVFLFWAKPLLQKHENNVLWCKQHLEAYARVQDDSLWPAPGASSASTEARM